MTWRTIASRRAAASSRVLAPRPPLRRTPEVLCAPLCVLEQPRSLRVAFLAPDTKARTRQSGATTQGAQAIMNSFEISGRIGHLEQSGRTLKLAIYNTRTVRGQEGAEFKQQRIGLVTFGPKAEELLATYTVGQTVKLGGFIRAGKYGIDLVVTKHELVVKAEAEEPAAGVAPEIAPEPSVEATPEPSVEAPKQGRGRKKLAA
jgi:hypothetical protein